MRVRQLDGHELRSMLARPDQPWLQALSLRLRNLPTHPDSRVLIAEEDGHPRALLGLKMYWVGGGHLRKVTIVVLGVDPAHNRRGIGSRLVRFAEGLARINGCTRVEGEADVEGWEDGRCWAGLGYDGTEAGLLKVLRSPVQGTVA